MCHGEQFVTWVGGAVQVGELYAAPALGIAYRDGLTSTSAVGRPPERAKARSWLWDPPRISEPGIPQKLFVGQRLQKCDHIPNLIVADRNPAINGLRSGFAPCLDRVARPPIA